MADTFAPGYNGNAPLAGDPNPVIGYGSPGHFPAGSVGGTSSAPITYAQTQNFSPQQIAQIYGQEALSNASNPASGAYGQSQYGWRPGPNGSIVGNPANADMDPGRLYKMADGSMQNRAMLIDGIQKAGYSGLLGDLNGMPNSMLQQIADSAYNVGQTNQAAQQAQQAEAAAAEQSKKNFDLASQTMQTNWQKAMADTLTNALKGPFGPGMIPVLNADLQKLGLPQVSSGQAQGQQGVMPNGISPAVWDAMGTAAQQMILQAWQARGGDPKDFLAGIDAQRPSPAQGTNNVMARYAPIAA